MKVVLVRFKDDDRRDFELDEDTTIIGRRSDAGLRVPAGDVSRQHCQISIADDKVTVKDLGSANGTFINGKRVAESKLAPGDRLSVGPVVFVVQIDGKPQNIEPADAELAPPVSDAPAVGGGEEVFELGENDFDIEDAISAFDELDEDSDMP
ncbi:MAG: FHA domain-containing protein [Planctomycetota bacterium]